MAISIPRGKGSWDTKVSIWLIWKISSDYRDAFTRREEAAEAKYMKDKEMQK